MTGDESPQGPPHGPSDREMLFTMLFMFSMTLLVLMMKPVLWLRKVIRDVR